MENQYCFLFNWRKDLCLKRKCCHSCSARRSPTAGQGVAGEGGVREGADSRRVRCDLRTQNRQALLMDLARARLAEMERKGILPKSR